MSLLNAAADRHDDHEAIRVPVVMPVVAVTIDQHGYLDVMLDREPYSADGVLKRDDLGRVLKDIAEDLGTPVRVEIRETDSSTFTDIVAPDRPRLHMITPPIEAPNLAGVVAGDGFLPNEEVAVAVVVAHQLAGADGTARLHLPPALLEAHPGFVVLIGQKSGTVMVSGGAV